MPAQQPLDAHTALIGCDFTSSPSRRKSIVLARGELHLAEREVRVLGFERFERFEDFSCRLRQLPAWVGGFDMPFGLPRELVQALGWPLDWRGCMAHYAALSRAQIRDAFAAFCAARPAGAKFAHRATDLPAGSSPSMKWVNPPVAYMLHAGVHLLLDVGAHLPGLCDGDPRKVALEAYPGWIARQLIGRRSYKSDDRRKQTPERAAARALLIEGLAHGVPSLGGLRIGALARPIRQQLQDDASGDSVDAVLCLLQAGWAHGQHLLGVPNHGLPPDMDPLEGWIVGVQPGGETGMALSGKSMD